MAVNREIKNVEVKEINKGTMKTSFVYNKKKWRIIMLYS